MKIRKRKKYETETRAGLSKLEKIKNYERKNAEQGKKKT